MIALRDVFGHKSNISLVMDFMDTDLEIIIKDPTIVLTGPNIKSYIMQTLLGNLRLGYLCICNNFLNIFLFNHLILYLEPC